MDLNKVAQLRAEFLKRIADAIIPDEPVTSEMQEAIPQALCIMAGNVFGAQNQIPVEVNPGWVIGSELLEAMEQWHEDWVRRN